MYCPFCEAQDTKVIDSRLVSGGAQVRRRRTCEECGERFTTFETVELVLPRVIKRDGRRTPFDEEKLASGILRALEKRPISSEQTQAMLDRLKHRLRATGEREIDSQQIGKMVMEELRELDEVAYVRFASVYRNFQSVGDFDEEITLLQQSRKEE